MLSAASERLVIPRLGFASCLLAIPFLEYLGLRLFLREGLGMVIGWGPWLTDFDLLIPFPVAFTVSLLLHPLQPPVFKLRTPGVLCNVMAVGTFIAFNLFITRTGVSLSGPYLALWWALALCVFSTAFVIGVPLKFYFYRGSAWVWLACLPLALTTILATKCFYPIWRYLVPGVAGTIQVFFGMLSPNLDCRFWYEQILVSYSGFALRIDPGCAGLDGFMLASYFALFQMLRFRERFRTGEYWMLLVFSWVSMFFINAARITLLFVGGVFLRDWLGEKQGMEFLTAVFHAHVGWIFYFGGLCLVSRGVHWLATFSFSGPTLISPARLIRKMS